jgi:hypothetical protein
MAASLILDTDAKGGNILLTEAQLAAERITLRIAAAPEVVAAKAGIRSKLLEEPVGRTHDGAARIDYALDQWARSLALRHAAADFSNPQFIWSVDETPRKSADHHWAGAGIGGVGNPDNVYRTAFIDGSATYEVAGQRATLGSGHFSLELTRQEPGRFELRPAEGNEADLGDQLGILTINDLDIADDGSFRVTIGPREENDGRSRLRSAAGILSLNHRDTLTDWSQLPNRLSIRHVAGGQPDSLPGEAVLIERTAAGLPAFVDFWGVFRDYFLGAPAPNMVAGPVVRDGGWGLAAGGRFELDEDEVLLIKTAPSDAIYTGFQIADPWMMVGTLPDVQNSLNGNQIVADADGGTTYVIAARDPGLANWLDTGGGREGWFMLRWQWLGARGNQDQLVRSARLARPSELDGVAPDVVRVSKTERAHQLRARQIGYDHRLAG